MLPFCFVAPFGARISCWGRAQLGRGDHGVRDNEALPGLNYRFWCGPIIGFNVTHVWASYATCLFFEFGKLTPGEKYTDRRGQVQTFEPKGVWSITSMD